MKHLIIGYGVVGHNLESDLSKLDVDVCDKYKNIVAKESRYDVGWVCVDTPLVDEKLDCSEVVNAIKENDCNIYVIKSTVPVGFTKEVREELNKNIIFSPEYYGGTQHCNNYIFDFTILGGVKEDCIVVQQELQNIYDGRHRFFITDSDTAEMAKFMENSWLATKVSFCCDFFRACEKQGIDYEELRELFILDPRVNPSHTFVYKDHPYFNSHCLNKDVPSIANQYDMGFLKEVIKYNDIYK